MEPSKKKLIALLSVNALTSVVYMMMAPFYPTEMHKNKGVSYTVIGLMFAIFSFACFITSPILGRYLSVLGRRRTLIVALVIDAVSLFFISFV